MTAFLLVAFGRFSAVNYPVIAERDIASTLVPNFQLLNDSTGTEPCQINLTQLGEWTYRPHQSGWLQGVGGGGVWSPEPQCRPRFQVAIIIPYRDRATHLAQFLHFIHPFLQAQLLDYKIVVVEQSPNKPFNRAKLFNVGFLESKAVHGHTSCLVFHDIDLIPLDARNIYACASEPRHLSSNLDQFRFNLPYIDLFGGAVAMAAEVFEEANGFSNRFFGWGGEDDDFRQNRIPGRPLIRLEPHIARYTSLRHIRAEPSAQRFDILKAGDPMSTLVSPDQDGLSNIEYNLIKKQLLPLYTHILVEL